MFTKESFDVFEIEGLDARMEAIRAKIQPVFQAIGEEVVSALTSELEEELMIHIAQHRRRTAYAPESTWAAFGGNKRGYKKFPHFELTINEDYIGMWLSFIDNPEFEKEIAQAFIDHQSLIQTLDETFVVSLDHTKPDVLKLKEMDLEKGLIRWRDVKKGEFMVGRIIHKEEDKQLQPDAQLSYMLSTYQALLPLYNLAYKVRK
ncbi:DUF1054 domain-containing protein [Vagococcus xieshaowenii]|uniref:UPF0637 protein E4031_03210 n=1 Tax=Vagococcus xieshaowenii TaxID=2562451 RepID=A0AAJ5EF88_9ENTE|nr:DUF1054 domain-containing protein [Vagococcus xieshaowenii]QCA28196.1 DUF1054 domain-containing protein [Vagococcus xieshaowenii]TFZ42549.1 DUF1054 domain-containing protein [Vagococcus xieshaowenii]